MQKLEAWILQNLNSRFYIGNYVDLDKNNTIVFRTKLGFEDQKELSFFLLGYSNF